MTLRLAEELTLLMLHDENGVFLRVPQWSMRCAFGGAILMDLALENRIDSDPRRLVLLDRTPIGDELLDPTLAQIARERNARCPLLDGESVQSGRGYPGRVRSTVSSPAAFCDNRTTCPCGYSSRDAIRSSMARLLGI